MKNGMSSGDASREERAVARVQALAMQLCHSHPIPAGGTSRRLYVQEVM